MKTSKCAEKIDLMVIGSENKQVTTNVCHRRGESQTSQEEWRSEHLIRVVVSKSLLFASASNLGWKLIFQRFQEGNLRNKLEENWRNFLETPKKLSNWSLGLMNRAGKLGKFSTLLLLFIFLVSKAFYRIFTFFLSFLTDPIEVVHLNLKANK